MERKFGYYCDDRSKDFSKLVDLVRYVNSPAVQTKQTDPDHEQINYCTLCTEDEQAGEEGGDF